MFMLLSGLLILCIFKDFLIIHGIQMLKYREVVLSVIFFLL